MALFPVACFKGVFRWITCPMSLHRLARDLRAVDRYLSTAGQTAAAEFLKISLGPVSSLGLDEAAGGEGKLCFGDLEFQAKKSDTAASLGKWFASHAFPLGRPMITGGRKRKRRSSS